MNSSSIRLLDTIEWTKKFNFGRHSALGNFLEPSKTNANTIIQTILGAPFAWRWNRAVTGFITTAGQQDYLLLGAWVALTPLKVGTLLVDSNGNSQQVTTAGTTSAGPVTFNNTPNSTTNDGSVVWTNLGPIGVFTSSSYTFGWIETTSVSDQGKWIEVQSQLCLGSDSKQSRPRFISAQGDDGQGNITFRLTPVPDAAYPVAITVQQKPLLFTKLSQTWAPIPDEYSHIYNWGLLSLMFLFSDDARFTLANQKFVGALLSSSEGLDETKRSIFLNQWQAITGQPTENSNRMSQGEQFRGI